VHAEAPLAYIPITVEVRNHMVFSCHRKDQVRRESNDRMLIHSTRRHLRLPNVELRVYMG